jgi:serine protease Do
MIRHTLLTLCILLNSSLAQGKIYTSFADIAERAIPGVVNIRTTSYVARKDPSLDLYQFFLKGTIPRNLSTHSIGSGVLIDKKGLILTNNHVVEGANVIEVLFAKSRKKVKATVLGTDKKTDLALLQVNMPGDAQPLDLGDSDTLRVVIHSVMRTPLPAVLFPPKAG